MPQDPFATSMLKRLKPIGTEGLPLGSDELGRDLLSRLILGARLSLFMGIAPVIIAFVIGSAIGIFAGYVGGWANSLIMRCIDVLYAFPSVLLAIALSGALGAGIVNALVSLTVVFIPQIARIAESVTTGVRRSDYVDAARASGASALLIVRRHVLGNVIGPIFVYATGLISVSMILASGLSFLGLGVKRRSRSGADAQHPAHRHLHPALGRGAAGRDDLHHLGVLQHAGRRPALGDGGQAMNPTPQVLPKDRRDLGGPRQPLLIVRDLKKHFPLKKTGFGLRRERLAVRAVDGVSFEILKGETLAWSASPAAASRPPRAC